MGLLRLGVCVGGVYAMFLLWAIAQERLSVPFSNRDGTSSDRFRSSMFISTAQSILSSLSSLLYILARRKPGESISVALGLDVPSAQAQEKGTHGNGKLNGHGTNGAATKGGEHNHRERHPSNAALRQKGLMFRYFQCALFVTLAAPLGFAALAHISYPAMVLGKSCKLVPVMIMNVLLYRRKFAPHKYLVVAMVTAGITMFMFFGTEAEGKGKPKAKGKELASATDSIIGVFYLLVNLAIDGATNSTQDEIFARYRVTGQQMMFWMNVMCTLLTATLISLPLPYIPVLHPSSNGLSDLSLAMEFVREHPGIVVPLIQFAMTGALGQLFIFETLQHFGSLTLVTITLTRKMFTMILSVVVYDHKLTLGQWGGAAVVFAGITVEAWVKRKDVHAKRVIQEKEKAKLKAL